MEYTGVMDENGDTIKEYETDEYGNVNVLYIDEAVEENEFSNMFRKVLCSFKLELSINKELYEKGNISKELYEKVENIILDRMEPLSIMFEGKG